MSVMHPPEYLPSEQCGNPERHGPHTGPTGKFCEGVYLAEFPPPDGPPIIPLWKAYFSVFSDGVVQVNPAVYPDTTGDRSGLPCLRILVTSQKGGLPHLEWYHHDPSEPF